MFLAVAVTRTTTEEGVEEMVLPVALHSPLFVLMEQLEDLSGIPAASQILILCDLTDPDRNNDVVLTRRNNDTLLDIGVRDGSYLTLHRLQPGRRTEPDHRGDQSNPTSPLLPDYHLLHTPIRAADADHSYNGILFDIQAKSPYRVEIASVFIGGMLGRVVRVCLSVCVTIHLS